MGGQSSKPPGGLNQYQRFGPVTVQEINDPQNGQPISMMHFSRPVQNQKVLNSWNQQITRIEDSQSREVLLLPQKHVFQKAGMCGSNGIVHLTYQNFPYVLDSEIKNRKKLDRYFIQTQMWYLLYNIVRAGNKFQKLNKKVGDVNPHNVVINDDGQIKVVSTCSIPNEQTNFQKIIQDKNAKVYLAPQQLNDQYISKCQYPTDIDPCKAEVFSIGLTILSSAILQDCFEIYNMGTKKINENLLNKYIETLRQIYSPYLSSIIVSMLNLQPKLRRRASQIYNQLYPHNQKILDLQQFFNPQQAVQGSRYVQQVVPTPLRQSVNQPTPYLNQPVQNSGYYPTTTTTVGYPIQQRVVYQDNIPTIYNKQY